MDKSYFRFRIAKSGLGTIDAWAADLRQQLAEIEAREEQVCAVEQRSDLRMLDHIRDCLYRAAFERCDEAALAAVTTDYPWCEEVIPLPEEA